MNGPSLPKLLQALALGVKAVQSLPISSGKDKDDSDEETSDGEDDEFNYLMAFPEFSSLCIEARQLLFDLLNQAIHTSLDDNTKIDVIKSLNMNQSHKGSFEFDYPAFWDCAAEACEGLLDRVEMYIQSVNEKSVDGFHDDTITTAIKHAGIAARAKAKGGWNQMIGSLADIEKPQSLYQFQDTINNSRIKPFIPTLHPAQPFKINPVVELEYADGHGIDTRTGNKSKRNKFIPDDVVAPIIHYVHPYQLEIDSLRCDACDLKLSFDENTIPLHGLTGTLFNPSIARVQGVWIDNQMDLIELCDRISNDDIREIAVDLEAHSYRSFSGFVCLMQISLRRPSRPSNSSALEPDHENSISNAYDFLIDTLSLRRIINTHLAPIFANPRILKVMHGANSDIQWLQRDFGIYVMNLFDTGVATRYLPHLGSCGLAKILSTFANVQSDKKHQLSDWRERPLRKEMRTYAVSDTVYLLDLYDRLKVELSIHDKRPDIVELVFNESKEVCLLRYDKEPFYPSAYKRLVNWRRDNSIPVDLRENVLRELFDLRDRVARELDESLHYICPDSTLVRIACNVPMTLSALQALVKPIPPFVLFYADEIISTFQSLATPKTNYSDASATKTFTKCSMDTINNAIVDSSESLKTELSPKNKNGLELPSDTEEEREDDMVEKNVVDVHPANKGFIASSYNTLQQPSEAVLSNDQKVDGLCTVSIVRDVIPLSSGMSVDVPNDESLEAGKKAAQIHQQIAETYSNEFQRESKVSQDEDESDESSASSSQETSLRDNALPRSLREIYRISNQNRIRSRDDTALSQFSLGLNQNVESYLVDTIDGANNVIASAGPGGIDYFHESKRQRALTVGVPVDVNIEFMRNIGWLDNEEDIKEATMDAHLNPRQPSTSTESKTITVPRKGKQDNNTVQMLGKPSSTNTRAISNIDSMALYDPKELTKANPYYSGAAIRGSSDFSQAKKKEPKSDRVKTSAGDRRTGNGNKTYVYRK